MRLIDSPLHVGKLAREHKTYHADLHRLAG